MKIDIEEFLHPRIVESILPLYINGHYKHAALESMIQVEMALREKGLAPRNRYGVHLVKWVMKQGQHITLSVPLGEELQDKARILFQGAFGYYRNYAAHDGAKIDQKICFRVMVLASELLDLVSASKRSFEGIGGIDGIIESGIFRNVQEFKALLEFLDGQQILDHDYSEYETKLEVRGFNKVQEEAMFDFGFVTYDEWETGIDPEAGLLTPTLVGEIKLTNAGIRVLREIDGILSGRNNGG